MTGGGERKERRKERNIRGVCVESNSLGEQEGRAEFNERWQICTRSRSRSHLFRLLLKRTELVVQSSRRSAIINVVGQL
jgi:hypothetical protein